MMQLTRILSTPSSWERVRVSSAAAQVVRYSSIFPASLSPGCNSSVDVFVAVANSRHPIVAHGHFTTNESLNLGHLPWFGILAQCVLKRRTGGSIPPRPHPDASHHDVHQHPCGNWLPGRGTVQQGRLALHVPMVLLQMVPTNFSHCSRLPCRSSLTCSGL